MTNMRYFIYTTATKNFPRDDKDALGQKIKDALAPPATCAGKPDRG